MIRTIFHYRYLVLLTTLIATGCTTLAPGPEESVDNPAEVNLKLGIAYMQSNPPRLEFAREKLDKALTYDPELAEAHNALGVLYEELGNGQRAEKHFRQAVEFKPDFILARMNYGRFLCDNGRAQLGEQEFLIAAADPESETRHIAYHGAGVCARAQGDLVLAANHFLNALQANPYSTGTLLEMATLSYDRNNYNEARSYLLRYHKQAGYNPASLNFAIKIEEALGDKQQRDEYRRLLKANTKPS